MLELHAMSHFEQVHRVSEFGGLNLVKAPFWGTTVSWSIRDGYLNFSHIQRSVRIAI
jgi:hypothetical protein